MTAHNTNCKACTFNNGECELKIPNLLVEQFPFAYKQSNILYQNSKLERIINFHCPMALNQDAKNYLVLTKNINPENKEEIKSTLKNITRNKYYLIYFLDDNLDQFKNNLDSLYGGYGDNRESNPVLPVYLSIVNISPSLSIKNILPYLDIVPNTDWKIHNVLDKTLNPSRHIDMVLGTNMEKSGCDCVAIWNNKYLLPNRYFDRINDTINYFINKSVYFIPDNMSDFNGLYMPISAYTQHHNNFDITLEMLTQDTNNYKLRAHS